jgi:hypothetical protein
MHPCVVLHVGDHYCPAKGALIGLQFEALFTDNLYFKLSEQAIKTAMRMKELLYISNTSPIYLQFKN